MSASPLGPFDTESAVIEAIGLRTWRLGDWTTANSVVLHAACADAGVELGAYDRRIIAWLATFEPQTCAVIAGLIERAAAP